MSWTSLSTRLEHLPLLLAGPMLRQVTPTAVTVWVALLRPATVALRVFKTGTPGTNLMSSDTAPNAPRATTAIGKNLHVVAVTVRSETELTPGVIYCYDLTFVEQAGPTRTLADAATAAGGTPPVKPFAYAPHDFPSFALPPADLNDLRLVHGSCRKPHGGWVKEDQTPVPDQLSTLDGLIASSSNNAIARPHQLLLTGDQIYADDCDDELLVSLTDAGDVLLGWSGDGEILPSADATTHKASALAAGTRWDVITSAGFTGDDRRSHLMSLGEYFAMYLFAWSEVLWSDPLTYDEFEPIVNATMAVHPTWTLPPEIKSGYLGRQKAVQTFRSTLIAVRRALANVPTYMILDDHEVTDDFNMTRHFVDAVYADDLGIRIVQNGLTAYAVCQVWGNVPEQFDAGAPTAAGTQLLAKLADVAAATDNPGKFNSSAEDIRQLVGVHQRVDMNDGTDGSVRAFHAGTAADNVMVSGVGVNTKSLRFNFTVEGPAHQVLVTDTRTWRGFVPGSVYPSLLYKQLDDQINGPFPPLGNRLQLIVFTTNAPPIAFIRLLATTRADPLFRHGPDKDDLYDSWLFPSRAFDEMLVAVSKRLPQSGDTIAGSVLFLSGDVHFSFSSRLAYWAETRLGDASPQKAEIVVGQLVSSSLKNEADLTLGIGLAGYGQAPKPYNSLFKAAPFLLPLLGAGLGAGGGAVVNLFSPKSTSSLRDAEIGAVAGILLFLVLEEFLLGGSLPPHVPEAYAGWNIAPTGDDKVITKSGNYPLTVSKTAPTYEKNLNRTELSSGALLTPDYRYRLDYLTAARSGQTTSTATPVVGAPSSADKQAATQYFSNAAALRQDLIGSGARLPDCVGNNAIGEITFTWPAGDAASTKGKVVKHRVHWQSPGPQGKPMWAEYDVFMDLETDLDDDKKKYPDLTKKVAP